MVVRMIEYDFSIGLEAMEKEKGKYRMYLPHSSILYLRGDKEPGKLTVEVVAPEGETWEYKVPAILPPALLYHEIREVRKPGVKGNAGRIQRNRRTSGERIPGKRKRERIP